MFRKLIAVALLMLPVPAAAATLPIVGGVTTVEVTANLAGLGLTGAPFGTAQVDTTGTNPVFSFPITGGSSGTNTLIEHDGSGVTLMTLTANPISATVSDFLIDVSAGTVSGFVNQSGPAKVLFDFGMVSPAGIELTISSALASDLTAVFGAPNLSGAQFGLANTAPEISPIPLPAGLPLLAAGLGAFWVVRRRRRILRAVDV